MSKLTEKITLQLKSDTIYNTNTNPDIDPYLKNLYTPIYPEHILSSEFELNSDINSLSTENYLSSVLSIPKSDTTSIYNLISDANYLFLSSSYPIDIYLNDSTSPDLRSSRFLYYNDSTSISVSISLYDSIILNNYINKVDIRYVSVTK